jgi:fumarate reductase flavoprotein subunit
MEKSDISRRSFLKGAVGAAGVAALATEGVAHAAESSSAADEGSAGTSSGNHWSWSVAPDPITDDDCSESYDCDICIIGLGTAGCPSALYAATHGLNTIVLQKGDDVISNGWCANAINNKAYLATGGEPFDTTQLYSEFAQYANGRDNGVLVKMFLDRSHETMDWILDQTTEIEPQVVEKGQSLGWYNADDFQSRYSRFLDLLKLMASKAQDAGAQVLWDTPAVRLVTNDDGSRVTGAIGQDANGNYVKVNASMGVIMCCGDITDDDEMLECYAPLLLGVHNLHGFHNNTGDGVKMASWIGAQITPAPHALMMHFDPTWLPEGDAPFSGIPWLRVNINGKRFQNEDLPYQSVVTGVSQQPEKVAFQICDSHWMDHINDYPNPNSHSRENPDPEGNWKKFIETGAIIESDTLEGLADAYGINKENFLATVERYNELCDKGVDEDFGVNGTFMTYNSIKEPPFYAIKRVPSVLATVGGVQINDDLRVLSESGDPIDGLYAAGDMGGSFYGHEYPMVLPGGSIGRGFTFGILSVKAAAGDLESEVE